MNEKIYYLWLSLRLGAQSRTAVRLLRIKGSARDVYEGLSEELFSAVGVRHSSAVKLTEGRDLSDCEELLRRCERDGISVITPDMPEYPRSLCSLMDMPLVLFCKGELPDFNNSFNCAVVGTRKMTEYGKKTAYSIGRGLADGGAVVVSGLALGIDSMAMLGAQSRGGQTVGVLGCGIDIVYPPEHKDFFARTIASGGAIITEYPPGTPPSGHNFPARNRIISGLCQATLVVEANIGSGSLITARHALYQGREVFAVPGNVGDPMCEGSNALIKSGAIPVTNANDILSRFEFLYPHLLKLSELSDRVGSEAQLAAAKARVISSSDRKSGFYGSGMYGGSAKRKRSDSDKDKASPTKERVRKEKELPAKSDLFERLTGDVVQDRSMARAHVDQLGEKERAVYAAMKPNTPMLPDEIAGDSFTVSEVLTAMTLLEIAGAIESGAGGYFIRFDDGDEEV